MNVPLFYSLSKVVKITITQIPIVSLIFLLFSCGTTDEKVMLDKKDSVTDLSESVKLVGAIIRSGKLGQYLEDGTTDEGVQLILNNFSPASIALEIEVLNSKKPVLALFVSTLEKETYAPILHRIAEEYCGLLTFFIIDSDTLFSLAQQAEVKEIPTVIFLKDRKEVVRLESDVSYESIKVVLKDFL
jgi:hypothetical protein